MEDLIEKITKSKDKILELEKKRDELNHEIWTYKRELKNILVSKPKWRLFIRGYCHSGWKEDYDTESDSSSSHLTIDFDGDKVIIEDSYVWRDCSDEWVFIIPLKKFLEFCSADDYMQKVIDRYNSIKNVSIKKEETEREKNEKELYLKLKEKYG